MGDEDYKNQGCENFGEAGLTAKIKNPVLRNILIIILYIAAILLMMFLLPLSVSRRPFFR